MQQLPIISKVKSFLNFMQISKKISGKKIALDILLLCIFPGNLDSRLGNIDSSNVKSNTGKINSIIASTTAQINGFAGLHPSAFDQLNQSVRRSLNIPGNLFQWHIPVNFIHFS
ncbi:MAG: hypothetical protein C5S52_08625 [ANME-2 cluster archaeon]|nr:hypothetical protein [ANME-2 cluster archaeon]